MPSNQHSLLDIAFITTLEQSLIKDRTITYESIMSTYVDLFEKKMEHSYSDTLQKLNTSEQEIIKQKEFVLDIKNSTFPWMGFDGLILISSIIRQLFKIKSIRLSIINELIGSYTHTFQTASSYTDNRTHEPPKDKKPESCKPMTI